MRIAHNLITLSKKEDFLIYKNCTNSYPNPFLSFEEHTTYPYTFPFLFHLGVQSRTKDRHRSDLFNYFSPSSISETHFYYAKPFDLQSDHSIYDYQWYLKEQLSPKERYRSGNSLSLELSNNFFLKSFDSSSSNPLYSFHCFLVPFDSSTGPIQLVELSLDNLFLFDLSEKTALCITLPQPLGREKTFIPPWYSFPIFVNQGFGKSLSPFVDYLLTLRRTPSHLKLFLFDLTYQLFIKNQLS